MVEDKENTEVALEPVKQSKILATVRKYWKKGVIITAILAVAAGAALYLTQPEADGGSTNGDTV